MLGWDVSRDPCVPVREWLSSTMAERDLDRINPQPLPATTDDQWEEAGEEEVPTIVLYIVAGLLLLAFTLYLVVGGGHAHFH